MTEVGVIGYGSFGQFMCAHLKRHVKVSVWNRTPIRETGGITVASIEVVASKPVVILCIPVLAQESMLKQIAPYVQPGALVLDVTSVKVKPVELMLKYLPKDCQIVATHPLFGPESGKHGIKGLNMVVWPVRVDPQTYLKVKVFVADKLGLNVIEKSPATHDQEMAYVHGLTFFIGEALKAMKIPDEDLKTASYQHLLEIQFMSQRHSPELFATMELENPYAEDIRAQFLKELEQIQTELSHS